MDMVRKHGQMVQRTEESIIKVTNTVKAHTSGLTDPRTLVVGQKTKLTVLERTNGLMVENMKENGNKITCMEWGFIPGQMVDVMKENTRMI